MIKNKRILIIGGISLFSLILFFLLKGSGSTGDARLIVEVNKGAFVVEVNTSGELEAKNSTKIMGPSGLRNYRLYQVNIQDIIDEGTIVKKGQYVARLDPSELTSKIKDSQLEVETRQSQFTQTQLDTTLTMRKERDELINLKYAVEEKRLILEQSKFEPPATIKQAEIEVEKAERAYQQKKENYQILKEQNIAKMQEVSANLKKETLELEGMMKMQEQFVVLAPEDGMLIYKKHWDGTPVKEGGQISAWDPVVATLPDLSSMNTITYVNEVDIRRIAVGQKVDIGLDAFPDKKLTGVVKRVANVGEQRPNSDSKVFQVTVEIDKIDNTLRPGMTTSNKIYTNIIENALYVPLECLHNFQDSITYVFKREGLGYTKQEVNIGLTNANSAEILQGLNEDDALYLSIPSTAEKDDIALLPEMNGKRGRKKEKVDEPTDSESAGRPNV